MTSDQMSLGDLAEELHMFEDDLRERLTSRQWNRYRARAVVRAAQSRVREYHNAMNTSG